MVAAFALLDSITAGVGFIYYISSCFLRSLRDDTKSGKSERWSAKSLKQQQLRYLSRPRTWLNTVQLLGTSIMFLLCVLQAIMLARAKGDVLSMKADHDVSAILFGSLIWLIWLLSLSEDSESAGHELFIPWMLFSLSYGVSAGISTAELRQFTALIALQGTRFVLIIALIASVVVFRQQSKDASRKEDHTVEETQPLIVQVDTQEASNLDGTSPANDDDWEDDDDDDDRSVVSDVSHTAKDDKDETEAQKEEKSQRKALRDRPWWEYLASFRIFFPFVRPRTWQQYGYLSIMVLNVLCARAITLGLPLVLGAIIDELGYRRFSYELIFAYVGLRFASSSSGVALIKNIVLYRWNTQQHDALTVHTFDHIMSLSADYHASKSTPNTHQILQRGQSVITLLQDICFDHLPVVADLLIALLVVSKLFGAYLCYAVAMTMILLSWSSRISMAKKTSMRRYYFDVWRNWYSHMSESFMHWRTVSEFIKHDHEKKRHREKTAQCSNAQIRARYFHLTLSAMQELVLTSGFAFVCIIAAKEIAAGRLAVGRFVVLITYWGQIMNPVTRLTGLASDISEQLVDAEKLLLLLEKQPTISLKLNAPRFEFRGGHVKVENCSFSYDNKRVVTNNVSFEALPGQTVALVGETGGGKSTIFNLLFRFFAPSSGRVLVDGQDISQVNLESYRSVLGLVPQNPVLFNTTIIKNVRYGRLNATKAEVVAACKASQFHEKVQKFPRKYKQKVGELSQKLSGGELQRLAIARAIIKDPGILLLDEATSAVDSVTETRIQDSLDSLSKGRTTFVIAHRLSTIMHADKILVIKGGEIVESGSHQDLLENGNGAYKELWDAQLKLSGGKRKSEGSASDKTPETSEDKSADLLSFDESQSSTEDGEEAANTTDDGNKGHEETAKGSKEAEDYLGSAGTTIVETASRDRSADRDNDTTKEPSGRQLEDSSQKQEVDEGSSSSASSSKGSIRDDKKRNYNTF